MRAVLYAAAPAGYDVPRVEAQVNRMNQWCESNGVTVVGTFRDTCQDGDFAFQASINCLATRGADIVLAHSRQVYGPLMTLMLAQRQYGRYGARLRFLRDGDGIGAACGVPRALSANAFKPKEAAL